jgi:hypothetical protein
MTLLSSGYNVERDRQAEKAMLPSVAESLVGGSYRLCDATRSGCGKVPSAVKRRKFATPTRGPKAKKEAGEELG